MLYKTTKYGYIYSQELLIIANYNHYYYYYVLWLLINHFRPGWTKAELREAETSSDESEVAEEPSEREDPIAAPHRRRSGEKWLALNV